MIEHLTIENIFITTILLSLGVLFYITIKTEKN